MFRSKARKNLEHALQDLVIRFAAHAGGFGDTADVSLSQLESWIRQLADEVRSSEGEASVSKSVRSVHRFADGAFTSVGGRRAYDSYKGRVEDLTRPR